MGAHPDLLRLGCQKDARGGGRRREGVTRRARQRARSGSSAVRVSLEVEQIRHQACVAQNRRRFASEPPFRSNIDIRSFSLGASSEW